MSVMLLRLPGTSVRAFSTSSLDIINSGCKNEDERTARWRRLAGVPEGCVDPVHSVLLSQGDQLSLSQFNDAFPTGTKVGGFVSSANRRKKRIFTREVHDEGNVFLCFRGQGTQFHVRVVSDKNVEVALASFPRGPRYLAGFLFSCVGRGSGYHGRVGVEAEVFKRRFPGVPLVGFFTGGELGPQEGTTNLAFYSYTSVFCLVSVSS